MRKNLAYGEINLSNERYKLMTLAYRMAEKGYHNPILLYVSPPDRGKTDTVDIFLRDHDAVYVVPSSTETKQHSLLKQRTNTICYILDEPDDWQRRDLEKVFMTMKHLGTGKLKPARATSFLHGIPYDVMAAVIILMNNDQFESYQTMLSKAGLLERALVIMSDQNDTTLKYVHDIYRRHKFHSGGKRLPHFKNDMSLCEDSDTELVISPKHQMWIDKHFKGHRRDTVEWIARMVTHEQFEMFMPFFLSYYDYKSIDETIEFEEKRG